MDRRRFLGYLGSGMLGGALGGAGAWNALGRSDELREGLQRERTDAAGSVDGSRGRLEIVWSVDTNEKAAALTFDDGPLPSLTPSVLDVLDRYGIKATFNVMGYNAVRHAELLRRTVASGHEIGNHTATHRDLAFQDEAETTRQLRGGRSQIEDASGVVTTLFRPPRGELTGSAARIASQLGFTTILWSVGGAVPGGGDEAAVRRRIARLLHPGAIVAFHDGIGRSTFNPSGKMAHRELQWRKTEIRALPAVIEDALGAGYRFLTVSQLMALSKPVPGCRYAP